MDVLFRTIHGSRLYNLHHAESDYDYYTVVDKVKNKKARYATHKIVDGVDSVVVDLGTFMGLVDKGVPQALEACFSQCAEIDRIEDLRKGVHAGSAVWGTYLRTIKSFALQDDFKHRRHALRLALNLRDLRRYGRFNPSLTEEQIEMISSMARTDSAYEFAMEIGMGLND